jgi:hypothetical protein
LIKKTFFDEKYFQIPESTNAECIYVKCSGIRTFGGQVDEMNTHQKYACLVSENAAKNLQNQARLGAALKVN